MTIQKNLKETFIAISREISTRDKRKGLQRHRNDDHEIVVSNLRVNIEQSDAGTSINARDVHTSGGNFRYMPDLLGPVAAYYSTVMNH